MKPSSLTPSKKRAAPTLTPDLLTLCKNHENQHLFLCGGLALWFFITSNFLKPSTQPPLHGQKMVKRGAQLPISAVLVKCAHSLVVRNKEIRQSVSLSPTWTHVSPAHPDHRVSMSRCARLKSESPIGPSSTWFNL